jgi:uncharacterized protein YbaR (Trm112 family)
MAPIPEDLLEILVCPQSKAALVLDGDTLVSTDPSTRRRYRIEDDIPIMLVEESEQLDPEEWERIMSAHGRRDVVPRDGSG